MAATLLKRKRTSSDAPFSFAGAFDTMSTSSTTTTTTTASSFNPVFGFPAMDPGRDAHLQQPHLEALPQQPPLRRRGPSAHPPPPPLRPAAAAAARAEDDLAAAFSLRRRPRRPLAGTFRQHHQPQALPQRRQGSLHSFWAINSAPTAAPDSMTGVQVYTQASRVCEDCGAALGAPGGDDGMDIDGGSSDMAPCGNCGKVVCFSCSVSSLGEEKRCLRCADRRVWVGGVGWTKAEVPAY
ncbi:hypothetical protein ACCO45_006636 [Purpureocillium lilacinum]|uniref:Uncharacterized protein n=1 Tax=Purpureocillium lilacinum TaxID=33203 RepID=A0ACC4DQ96_PURLI